MLAGIGVMTLPRWNRKGATRTIDSGRVFLSKQRINNIHHEELVNKKLEIFSLILSQ
jgi:hypothetical protein